MDPATIAEIALQTIGAILKVVEDARANAQLGDAQALAALQVTLEAESARVAQRLAELDAARAAADAKIAAASPSSSGGSA